MLEIIKDYRNMCIRVGEYEDSRPSVYWRREYEFHNKNVILDINDIKVPSFMVETGDMELDFNGEPTLVAVPNIVMANKFYAKHLGTQFNRRLYANMWELWIRPNFSDRASRCLRLGGKAWQSYDADKVLLGIKFKDHLKELEASGRGNLMPLIIIFEKHIDEIMDGVGPDEFSRMESSAYTRNLKFSQSLVMTRRLLDGGLKGRDKFKKLTPKEYREYAAEKGSFWEVMTGHIRWLPKYDGFNEETFQAMRLSKNERRLDVFTSAHRAFHFLKQNTDIDITSIKTKETLIEVFTREAKIYDVLQGINGGMSKSSHWLVGGKLF